MEPAPASPHTAVMQTNTTACGTPNPAPCLLRVFVVEDSPMIRERLVSLLSPVAGAQLVGFADRSEDAINEIVKLRPDAVVLDLNLAHGTGVDVLRALQDAAPEVAVYVLTNFANPQYKKLCLHLGARGFYDKSTEFEQVRDVIAARASQYVPN